MNQGSTNQEPRNWWMDDTGSERGRIGSGVNLSVTAERFLIECVPVLAATVLAFVSRSVFHVGDGLMMAVFLFVFFAPYLVGIGYMVRG